MLLWCLSASSAELDRRKASTSTPDMKLVISMSYGSFAETEFSKSAISSLTKQRNDVLWIAAAGNSGDNSTNFPAGYDEVCRDHCTGTVMMIAVMVMIATHGLTPTSKPAIPCYAGLVSSEFMQ